MRERPAEELGIDTYYYSMKSVARAMCSPLQHQIVTKGEAREEEGVRILSLNDYGYGTPEGCLGINCRHYMTPFIVGVNDKPDIPDNLKNITSAKAEENARAEAKQRAFEREIRKNKERLKIAREIGDKELIQKYKLKGITLNGQYKALLDENKFLYRNLRRERYVKNPETWSKTDAEIKQEFVRRESKYFRSLEDPAADYYGSARDSAPDRVEEIISNLEKIGVKVYEQNRNVFGYSPGGLPGVPGEITISSKASLSAWEHENLHALDDYEAGFSGARIFQDLNEHWRREKRAYDLEISMAKRLHNDELVAKLKVNKTREWNKIYRRR